MAKYTVFKLQFQTPLHIGLGRSAYDSSSSELHSDTLSSALAALKAQHGASASEVFSFMKQIAVSSAFPYVGDSYYLPRPKSVDQIEIKGRDATEFRKKLKDVQYINSQDWSRFLNGEVPQVEESQLHGSFLTEVGEDFKAPYRKQVNQRVSVSRSGEDDADPFYFEWMYFDSTINCGLYIIVETSDEKTLTEVQLLLEELGETGLGTDKSVGGGQFKVARSSIELPDIADSNGYVSLSLFLPSTEELELIDMKQSSYGLLLRGGYMAGSVQEKFRHLWKKSIYMFEAGSSIVSSQQLTGQIVDLRPEWNDNKIHPVYRSGKALMIPIKITRT